MLNVIMLGVIMLNIILLSVILLIVIVLGVIMLKSFRWVSYCWMSYCWMSYWWVSYCWISFSWVSLCWTSFRWLSWRQKQLFSSVGEKQTFLRIDIWKSNKINQKYLKMRVINWKQHWFNLTTYDMFFSVFHFNTYESKKKFVFFVENAKIRWWGHCPKTFFFVTDGRTRIS